MENTTVNDVRLSPHFKLGEFLNLSKYPDNKSTMQHVVNTRRPNFANKSYYQPGGRTIFST